MVLFDNLYLIWTDFKFSVANLLHNCYRFVSPKYLTQSKYKLPTIHKTAYLYPDYKETLYSAYKIDVIKYK